MEKTGEYDPGMHVEDLEDDPQEERRRIFGEEESVSEDEDAS